MCLSLAVELKGLQSLRVCYLAHRGAKLQERPEPPAQLVAATLEARKASKKELSSLTLKPIGLKGEALLARMCKFRSRDTVGSVKPPSALNIECTSVQLSLAQPTATGLVAGNILRSTGGVGAYRMLPQRRLNMWGEINNHCVAANSEGRIERVKKALELAAAIDKHTAAEKKIKARATDLARNFLRGMTHIIYCTDSHCALVAYCAGPKKFGERGEHAGGGR